ncbi:hypothetical protein SRABI128_03839 [Microbacterium sp. Bi128]|nr:hypothetical protein SRABI128_03839 [Microbacterium sp. Bi128]
MQDHREQHSKTEPGGHPDAAKVPLPWRAGSPAAERMGDHVDVNVAGIADHPGADPAAEQISDQAGELFVPRDADDDLGGVDAAGEVQERGSRILAGHDVVAAAQVQDQAALGFQRLGRLLGEAIGGPDVDRQQVPTADAVEDPGPAADQDFSFGAAGQPDHDAFPGRPAFVDALFGPVLGQALVHPVGEPQQSQFTQCREVAQAEIVREGGVDLVGSVDLAVAQALAEQLGGDVHEVDLVRLPDDGVRHRLRLVDIGDGADNVAQGRQMLDVDGGEHVDAGIQKRIDVLPALGIAAAGDVGVGVFVHDRGPWRPGQDSVEVHLLELRVPVGQLPGWNDFESLQQRPCLAAAVVHGERDDDVLAALAEPVGLFEHLVGLAHTRRGAQEDPQRSTCHAVILSLGLCRLRRQRGRRHGEVEGSHVDRRLAEKRD